MVRFSVENIRIKQYRLVIIETHSFFKVQSQSKLLKLTNETKKTEEFKKNQNLKTWSTNSYLREVFYECKCSQGHAWLRFLVAEIKIELRVNFCNQFKI